MANNRMVLLCNVCVPTDEWRYHTKGVKAIAKWYPGTSYASVTNFDDFLEEHDHPEIASEHYLAGVGQENPVRLVYESVGLPQLSPKQSKEESK